jgi:hypothetical protein
LAERLPAGARSFVNEFAPVPSESVEAPPEFEPIVAHDRNNADVPRHEETATPPHGDKLR